MAGTTNTLPPFSAWAAGQIKPALADVVAVWEAQRVYRANAAQADLLARLAKCEPTNAEWHTISNLIDAAEARQ